MVDIIVPTFINKEIDSAMCSNLPVRTSMLELEFKLSSERVTKIMLFSESQYFPNRIIQHIDSTKEKCFSKKVSWPNNLGICGISYSNLDSHISIHILKDLRNVQ